MSTKTTGLLAIALIVIVGFGIYTFAGNGKKEMKATPSIQPKSTSEQVSYKDGEYTQEGDYTSPGGPEQIEVRLTLKNGIIEQAEVTSKAVLAKSKFMQGVFIENFKPLVVGKNIKDLNLGKIAGSSLTPKGFNDAVEKIKAEAKS
ncbi:hypothetical protein COZ40_00925 [Candidatus Roizmanbacteria bacterium CG_4_10_14_3_um_filter_39_13]|uniref:FMN-binding domain-containing protein n=4 Tax=Candidatus Roizmaniibacteriota TaxID=1752723 RepID=A0A2H0KKZ1_9BACT|nr:MAG: hypothetical protein COV87_00580 [Candidatus Roizmanbacteria bacterium CG11_big_fil_rev_8_21_14_0_20_37_16]PIV07958.1 MAG: hypothetical protein COS52_05270 [Candidatus Roizmanbacteria bacterium CG03_land_8_20_14_0_80_39_12]PIV71061.1 MAG: hypothetical protein COW57_01665 [Candidatus Roizmanbacteria bacterium CG17_big_fil_post_rev_8_21_14_2_50_39_7]PIX68873.1 MAG: hypothetical protein COZ40_00925 [Candidatus Roizmanbacteria bacterium CG_4_10_14_3_um_filter_39_13]